VGPTGELPPTTVASLSLPAGNYELEADLNVQNSGIGVNQLVTCFLDGDNYSSNVLGAGLSGPGGVLISWHKSSASGGPFTVTLACQVSTTAAATFVGAWNWHLTATVVGTINIQ
jgi:hypothetical protein